MSIVVHLYYTGMNGSARRFVQEMEESGTAAAIRSEAGNEQYEYFAALTDPETVLLIDRWRDQEALDRHHASPMMKTIAGLRERYDLHMRAERSISEDQLPEQDQAFIRQ